MNKQKCNRALYQAFLQATVGNYSSLALSQASPMPLSHDSVSNWLKSEKIKPKEIWEKAKKYVENETDGLLIVDDTLLVKKHSKNIELASWQYSGSTHKIELGINLINLLFQSNINPEICIPVDARIYDKATDCKTKNMHFIEMIKLAIERQISVKTVVFDAWYSSLENLKTIRDLGLQWVTGLRKNRIVNKKVSLASLEFSDEGLLVHLRGFGMVKVFKFVANNGRIDYLATNNFNTSFEQITAIFKQRWQIEVFHREIKQTCGIDRCQARSGRAQRNHIASAILVWFSRFKQRLLSGKSFYQQSWEAVKQAITNGMQTILISS